MPLKIPHIVSVRQSTTVLSLSSILSSLSEASLSNHLVTLRRDISAYYIDHLLTHPTSLTYSSAKDSSGISAQTLSLLPSPSTAEDLPMRLKTVASVLDFLNAHLFAALPPSPALSFKRTLCKPVTTALLQQFLVTLLPSSLVALPPYLQLVAQAKELEEKYVVSMLGQDPRDREIKSWADAVSSHYERKRRAQILEDARQMILRQDVGLQIRVEVDSSHLPPTPLPDSAPATQSSSSGSEEVQDVSDDAWGLEGEESGDTDDVVSAAEEEDAWGFDDAPTQPQLAMPEVPLEPVLRRDTLAESKPAADDSAWGWDDSGEDANPPASTSPQATSSDNGADWDDDPWGDSSNPSPPPSAPVPAPKPASRLEKLASKAKAKATPPHSPPSVRDSPIAATRRPLPATARRSELVGTNHAILPSKKEAPKPILQPETYAISERARQLADTVDGILREGGEFASTAIFDSKVSTAQQQTRGSVILQTAPAVLDLFRALYPVRFGQRPTEPKSIVFGNDCIYVRERALSAARQCAVGTNDKLLETADSLEVIGKRWYEQTIVGLLILDICCAPMTDVMQDIQQDLVADSLKKAEGFVGTAEQDHYDDCEEVVMGVLSHVRKVARQWKVSSLVLLTIV
jgi:centromere/kinetochore protein ZW10